MAVGVAETERQDLPPAFAENIWFNLGIAMTVISVMLAVVVLGAIVRRAAYAHLIGKKLLDGRDIRRQCLTKDSDDRHDALKDAVNTWARETEILLSRDPAHEAEFTRGGHLAVDIPGAPSKRLGELVEVLDGRLERLAEIRTRL